MSPTKIRLLGGGIAVVVLLVAFGSVNAQSKGDYVPPDMDLRITGDDSGLSGRERADWVDIQVASAKSSYKKVQNMLDQARKSKDSIKITCLDDKLTQIHVNLRGIEERQAELTVAINGGDKASEKQQFTILKIHVARIQGLMAEAEGCVGDTDVVIGESETLVEISEDITIEDPTGPETDVVGIDQPPHASGFF